MEKYFNTTGPCNKESHYIVPILERRKELGALIKRGQYFVIHAARQTGKTTLIKTLVNHINKGDDYYALYCSLESVQVFVDPVVGIPQIIDNLQMAIEYSSLPQKDNFANNVDSSKTTILLKKALTDYCKILDKPLIILFDEIDGLEDGTLITFLRQLRDGYINRPEIPFVHSIALVGMRDIRDYKVKILGNKKTIGSKSPFNIIEKAFTLTNFIFEEVTDLYNQYTNQTGQIFEKQVIGYIFEQSGGQPWLVNAIAKEIIENLLENDFSKPITKKLAEQAIKNIILRRDTHIDSLLDKLNEERVCRVLEPIIFTTDANKIDFNDDVQYCVDLGLIKIENKILKPANPIYAEVIIRTLAYSTQYYLHSNIKNVWIDKRGDIDMNGLLKAFQEFWRENSDIWLDKYQYKEAAPHLILQAFLQRIINGGGDVLREYAYARKRIDLCVRYNKKKYPLELKIHYGKKTIPQGLEQLSEYMDGFGEKTGWLIIFDRRKLKNWDEKLYWKIEKYKDKIINIVGC